jgi:probable HAF family extracellular repeat protein
VIDLGVMGISATGDTESSAKAINDLGQVVGHSTTAASAYTHGFLWEDTNDNGASDPGEMVDLNTLLPPNSGWEIFAASGINNQGQIAGWGIFSSGETARRGAFVMTPLSAAQRMQILGASVTALVQSGVSLPADGQSLLTKLDAAQQSTAAGDLTAASNQLDAFLNQVAAFVGNRKLTLEQGQTLVDAARAIMATL